MGKRDLEKERQMELAAIWGSETDGDLRYPKRRRTAAKQPTASSAADTTAEADGGYDVLSDLGSDALSDREDSDHGAATKTKKKGSKKVSGAYRLHCFVAPGTERNAVRTVFEMYEPKVDLRVSQKGSLLNKTHYAVLTFRNKAMALHAVKMLDGTDQRDLIGVKEMKLGLMLSRKKHNAARRKMRNSLREERERRIREETEEEAGFISQFIRTYAPRG